MPDSVSISKSEPQEAILRVIVSSGGQEAVVYGYPHLASKAQVQICYLGENSRGHGGRKCKQG